MQRDYKVGLAVGIVMAGIALVWVATRPSLSPEARMLRSSQLAPRDFGLGSNDRASGQARKATSPTAAPGSLGSILNTRDAGQKANDGEPPRPQPQAVSRNPQPTNPAPQPAGAPDLTIYEKAEKIKTTRFHIVRKDETLSAISQQYYGAPNKWQKIVEANKGVIKDTNKLQPGTKLIIPE